jgi:hypothetical protein
MSSSDRIFTLRSLGRSSLFSAYGRLSLLSDPAAALDGWQSNSEKVLLKGIM